VPRCVQATGKQHTSPDTIAFQHSSQLTTRTTQVERVFGAFTPSEPRPASARTGAGPDGRADSTTLRSAARALPPCAAGLMHSTRADGAGIAAIAAIRPSPRPPKPRRFMSQMRVLDQMGLLGTCFSLQNRPCQMEKDLLPTHGRRTGTFISRWDHGEAEGPRKGSVTPGYPVTAGPSRYAEGSAAQDATWCL